MAAESYPEDWVHVTLHVNPNTGEMHSDGDHRVRRWIEDLIQFYETKNPGDALVSLNYHLLKPDEREG